MKKLAYMFLLIFILIIIIPLLILKSCQVPKYAAKKDPKQIKNINVYIESEDKVVQMELDEYVKGVLAAEMPASFEMEALKAQAVAARTYTLLKASNPNEELRKYHKGGDICTNPAHCQAWKSKDEMRKGWGFFSYYKFYEKISKAVDETREDVVAFQGEIINPLFHSTSGGKTENSEEVFAASLPYLRSVESPGEEASPRFNAKAICGFEEFRKKLIDSASDLVLDKKDIKEIKVLEQSEGGRVKKLQIGNKTFAGKDIRNIFSLNSTNFKIIMEGDNVVITTSGYGHGVGMSQFGANAMAKQGKGYKDIIKYYYKGVDVININDIKNK